MSTSRLLIHENPLQVLPSLACAIGLNEAMVLQQIHYWLGNSRHVHDGCKWVYNSVAEWQTQFPFWSETTIKRALTSLEKQRLVFTANYNQDRRDRSKWYSINYDALKSLETKDVDDASGQSDQMQQANMDDALGQIDQMQRVILTQCINKDTEITTETTTENKIPLPPTGGISPEPAGKNPTPKPKPEQPSTQDYQAALAIYNDTVADRLPHAVELNDKRRKGIKRLIGQLARKDLQGFRAYVEAFVTNAPPFYFGDNDRGWMANLDYLLRADTLTKVREGTL
ncbi:replication protein RepO [Sodalis endosymbiont of Spalangia cameroni]|uniref:replication protein RepO n=1 Tax=Sodalis praecaptivus TaxID=1239307 RepID=UPI0031F7C280